MRIDHRTSALAAGALLSACSAFVEPVGGDAEPERGFEGPTEEVPEEAAQRFAECPREQVLPPMGWDRDLDGLPDEPPITQSRLDTCLAVCPALEPFCIRAEPVACADFEDFQLCVAVVTSQCAAQPDNPFGCYGVWQDQACCADAHCDRATSRDSFDQCINANCSRFLSGFGDCIANDQECIAEAVAFCASAA